MQLCKSPEEVAVGNGNTDVTWAMNCELCILSDGIMKGREREKKSFFIPLKKHWDSGETILFPEKKCFPNLAGWPLTLATMSWEDMLKKSKPGSFGIKLS